MNLLAVLLHMAAVLAVVSAAGNRSRKSPPADSLFLGRPLGGCSLFGHSCLGGHGKRSSPTTVEAHQQPLVVVPNNPYWMKEYEAAAATAPFPSGEQQRTSSMKTRQQVVLESLLNGGGITPRTADSRARYFYDDYEK